MKLFTIGFTEKSAEKFFGLLTDNKVDVVVDIRLRPDGQLSGFAKRGDLPYFLRALADADYVHLPILSPNDELLTVYRENKDWNRYVQGFQQLMDERRIPDALDQSMFSERACCLLCSEAKPDRCHRSLIADRIRARWNDVEIIHL